ncbi:MFS transporter [Nocardioides sambongensis]|uniref:MFS transporter n=1 Tax=Nocardioides sambongensis TaxID=2589074 RepID=UPI0015E858DD|nr:MFS transporter [Nocardioides sambongensis]
MPNDSRRIALLLGLLFGLAGMGSSSAAVALPLLGPDLGVSVGAATWTISLYALMLAVTTATYGRLADLMGIKLPLLIGISLMAAGAVVAALAPTFEVLLLARLFQGAGAAAVPTLGVAIISARYVDEVRGLALGRLAGMAAAISALGPLVGGVVEAAFGWRAVMALPVLGMLVVPFIWRALTDQGTGAALDVFGALLVALTAGGVVLLVQSPSSGLLVAVAGALLVLLGVPAVTFWVRRRPDGFLPLDVIRNGSVVRCAAAAAAIPAAWFASLIAVPTVLVGEGWEPYQVGLLLLPASLLSLTLPRLAGRLIATLGPARTIGVAASVASVAMLIGAAGAHFVSPVMLAFTLLVVCVAFGVGQPALGAAVGDAVQVHVRGVALGVATLVFMTGGSVGSAMVGGLGELIGVDGSLLVLAALPLLALFALVPELRRSPAAEPAADLSQARA